MSRFVVHKILAAATACMLIALLASQQSAAQPTTSASASVLTPAVRFEGDVVVPTKAGAKTVRVILSNWGIHGTQKIERFPEQGFMVIQLHSGNVTIAVNGKEEKHRGGDFWTVPAGASMSVQVTSESAVLQTMAIRSTGK